MSAGQKKTLSVCVSALKMYNFPKHKGFCDNFPTKKRRIIAHAKMCQKRKSQNCATFKNYIFSSFYWAHSFNVLCALCKLYRVVKSKSYFLLPTTYFQLPTSNFQLPTSNFQLPTSYFLLPTSYFLLPTFYFLLPISYFLLPTSYFPPTFL